MSFEIISAAKGSRARLGKWKVPLWSRTPLSHSNEEQVQHVSEYMTPCGLEYTRQGNIPHLVDSPASLSSPSEKALSGPMHIAMEQFLGSEDTFVSQLGLSSRSNSSSQANSTVEDNIALFAHPFDVPRLSSAPFISHGKASIGVLGSTGNQVKMSMEMYVSAVAATRPDVVIVPGEPETSLFENWGRKVTSVVSVGRKAENAQVEEIVVNEKAQQQTRAETMDVKEKDVPVPLSQNQLFKRFDRSIKWMTDFFAALEKKIPLATSTRPLLFGTLGGLDHILEREKYTQRLVEAYGNELSGYVMYLPSDHPHFEQLLKASLETIPNESTITLMGAYDLFAVVKAIRAGVDVIDTSFLYALTEAGQALVCSFGEGAKLDMERFKNTKLVDSCNHKKEDDAVKVFNDFYVVLDMKPTETLKKEGTTFSGDKLESRLSQPSADTDTTKNGSSQFSQKASISPWRNDPSPIYGGCSCWTCSSPSSSSSTANGPRHTRAYLHHLLTVQDMLSRILLMKHNLHQFNMFMEAVRVSLQRGTFEKDAEAFLKRQ